MSLGARPCRVGWGQDVEPVCSSACYAVEWTNNKPLQVYPALAEAGAADRLPIRATRYSTTFADCVGRRRCSRRAQVHLLTRILMNAPAQPAQGDPLTAMSVNIRVVSPENDGAPQLRSQVSISSRAPSIRLRPKVDKRDSDLSMAGTPIHESFRSKLACGVIYQASPWLRTLFDY
jgi:hypothetical protein